MMRVECVAIRLCRCMIGTASDEDRIACMFCLLILCTLKTTLNFSAAFCLPAQSGDVDGWKEDVG